MNNDSGSPKSGWDLRISRLLNFSVKFWQLTAVACLCILSVIGAGVGFTQPREITAETVQAHYEHTGRFDYQAYLGPSYLYGPEPSPTTSPTPTSTSTPVLSPLKYPADAVQSFHFAFSYHFDTDEPLDSVSTQCRITASGMDAQGKRTTLDLSPAAAQSGPEINWDFILPVNDALAGGSITITASVFPTVHTSAGPVFESFIQNLVISREDGMLVIDRILEKNAEANLGPFIYAQRGIFNYAVEMKETSQVGSILITPPPLSPTASPASPGDTPVSGKIVGPGEPVFTRLLQKLEADFRYRLLSDTTVTDQHQTVSIVAVVQAGTVWSKALEIVPPVEIKNGDSVPFVIDYDYFTGVTNDIRNELGVSADTYTLVIRANVRVTGNTPYGRIDEVFTPSISTPLTGGTLKWAEELNQSRRGSFTTESLVPNNRSLLGMSVNAFSYLCLVLLIIFLVVFGFLSYLYYRNRAPFVPAVEKQARSIKKKYSERITESRGENLPGFEKVVPLGSMEDLVKVADELGKPVVHISADTEESGPAHIYQIYDSGIIYRYELKE
jgi:hypothetical protein